ncbi:MAG: hypothetical protein RJB39_65 [Candidatus Parcubacteria bacterium]|jgi:hypothetical protein
MQTNITLGILVRQTPLADTEWEKIILDRLELIKDDLRRMPLEVLGDRKMLVDQFGIHSLATHPCSRESDGDLSLTTKVIFSEEHHSEHVYPEPGTSDGHAISAIHKFWGLTRLGRWITVEVHTIYRDEESHAGSGRMKKAQVAQQVYIRYCDNLPQLCTFCHTTLQRVWKRLGEVIKECAAYRKGLYEEVQEWATRVEQEEELVGMIPNPPKE